LVTGYKRIRYSLLAVFMLAGFSQSRAQRATELENPQSAGELFKRLSPSVFVVETLDAKGEPTKFGSGVSIAKDQVVTNRHVVEDGKAWRVRQGDSTWTARIAFLDSEHDLCGLRVSGLSAIPVTLRVSSSLLNWALRYRNGGFEALAPKPRQDRGQSRAVTPQLASLIERLKRENPHRTGATLLRELALSSGQDRPALSASTLYRFLKQHGLSEKQLLAPPVHKKFEAELSNQIWQADMLFGPWIRRVNDGGRMQVFLHATLDDASRLIPHARFYASQGLDAALDCLRHAVSARGIPIRLYMDNGSSNERMVGERGFEPPTPWSRTQ
jgi:transposase